MVGQLTIGTKFAAAFANVFMSGEEVLEWCIFNLVAW